MKSIVSTLVAGCLLLTAHAEILAVPRPGEEFPVDRTVVWSPLLQASWDMLNVGSADKEVRVEPPNPLISALDGFRWEAGKVMPEGSWKVWSGSATREFLAKVNKEAALMTKIKKRPFTLPNKSESAKACFGILDRQVKFQEAFYRSFKNPMMFSSGKTKHPVRFFGVTGGLGKYFTESVRVLAWRPVDHSHAIQILCHETDDTVILYRPPVRQDFATACSWLRKWRSDYQPDPEKVNDWNDAHLHSYDEICIPYISLESKADFAPRLGGTRFHEAEKIPWGISRAEQSMRFQLNENGARVRGDAAFAEVGNYDPFIDPRRFRRFLYDRPFFIFLWRDKAEWPYFGAWIGDDSAMDHKGF